ncbi:MAG: hypothetical protein ACRDX8_01815 [Acidimicrobiales bacterium]
MTNSPRYPGEASMPSLPRPEVPRTVMNAVRLMYAGAAVSAVTLVVGLVTSGDLRATVHQKFPKYTAVQVTNEVHTLIAQAVIGGLIGVGAWIWMSIYCQKSRNWARITGTVLFGISTIDLVTALALRTPLTPLILAILVWAIGLGAVYFLWQRASTEFFTGPRMLS